MTAPLTFAQFALQRKPDAGQYYAHPHAKGTVAVSSHIWWTDQIAYGLYANGFNVLVWQPVYLMYTDDAAFGQYEKYYQECVGQLRQLGVQALIAGNSTAMAPHPKTGEMLHDAAGVKLVNYWWDEPRMCPPYAKRLGMTPADFIGHLKNANTLNLIWDIDVLEELAAFQQITNTMHLPLATTPEYWPQRRIPLVHRPLACCFLGNCHFVADYADTSTDPFVAWANKVVALKIGKLDESMAVAMQRVGPPPEYGGEGDAWTRAFWAYEVLNAVYMHRTRNVMVDVIAKHLKGGLALIGTGWEKMGLRANASHAESNTGHIYASSKLSLNLFGGCVHGGMPLRPFDIAASYGLIFTHYNRELPSLFVPGEECLAYRTMDEMLGQLDGVLRNPAGYEKVLEAGHARVFREHSWERRMAKVLEKLGI